MQELNVVEIDAISGGVADGEADQTVTITGKRMTWWEKLWYDMFG